MWLRALERSKHGITDLDPTVIREDNRGALKWAQDLSNHKKTCHIDIAYHSIREQVAEVTNLIVKFVSSAANFGDAFTKPLPLRTFRSLFRGIYGSDKL